MSQSRGYQDAPLVSIPLCKSHGSMQKACSCSEAADMRAMQGTWDRLSRPCAKQAGFLIAENCEKYARPAFCTSMWRLTPHQRSGQTAICIPRYLLGVWQGISCLLESPRLAPGKVYRQHRHMIYRSRCGG